MCFLYVNRTITCISFDVNEITIYKNRKEGLKNV